MTTNTKKRNLTFVYLLLVALIAVGVGVGIARLVYGMGATTNLNDSYPWGLWIIYDVFFVPFAAGAFVLLAITHFFHREEYHGLTHPVVLAGFLAELMVMPVLLMDLGRWYQVYNVFWPGFWNINSFMLQISLILTVYLVVVVLELSPLVLKRLNWTKPMKIIQRVTIFIAGLGVILASLHQAYLGSLFLMSRYKLPALWWTPSLPLLFFVSALFAGLAMAIFVTTASFRAFNRPLKLQLLSRLARIASFLMAGYLALRFADLLVRGKIALLFTGGPQSQIFLAVMLFGVLVPMFLFGSRRIQQSERGLMWTSALVLVGILADRVVTVMLTETAEGLAIYTPQWTEIMISLAAISAGVLLFAFATRMLPILPAEERRSPGGLVPASWPRWALPGSAVLLVAVAAATFFVVSPIAQAEAQQIDPAQAPAQRAYALGETEECRICHIDEVTLLDSGAEEADLEMLIIHPEPDDTAHGQIGCVTCHLGNFCDVSESGTHEKVVMDPTLDYSNACLLCHNDLPNIFPQDRLRTPHDALVHGDVVDVYCSDCHGAVGHGFDPLTHQGICTMTICLDCHVDRDLEIQLEDCAACHVGPHEAPEEETCAECHINTFDWDDIEFAEHPKPLVGKHAEVDCFSCHQFPSFYGLDESCLECHTRAHEFGGEDCEQCHDPAADEWSIADAGWEGHVDIWPEYVGAHTSVSCFTCHDDPSFQGMDSTCGACHLAPHDFGGDDCSQCHDAASGGWVIEGGAWDGHTEVWDAYAGKHATLDCSTCHGGGESFGEIDGTCAACHSPAHDFGGDECSTCHDVTAGWAFEGEGWPGHEDVWEHYVGKHTTVDCIGCHIEGYDISSDCGTCHEPPRDHTSSGYPEDCSMCHDAAEGWIEG